jgi:hypothetical protein
VLPGGCAEAVKVGRSTVGARLIVALPSGAARFRASGPRRQLALRRVLRQGGLFMNRSSCWLAATKEDSRRMYPRVPWRPRR